MKKLAVLAVFFAAFALLCACSQKEDKESEDTTLEIVSPQGFEDVTAPPHNDAEDTTDKKEDTTADTTEALPPVHDVDTAIAAAKAYLGEVDPDIGYKYAFSYDGMLTDNGVEYYNIRVSWYIEEQERYSLCGNLLITEDGEVSKYNW